jgi:hypothetical protein
VEVDVVQELSMAAGSGRLVVVIFYHVVSGSGGLLRSRGESLVPFLSLLCGLIPQPWSR